MTRKYLDVRRAIYEKNPSRIMNSYRSFSETIKLFKRPFWILFGIFTIFLIAFVFVVISVPNNPLDLIIMIPIVIISLALEIPREKYLYNESARANELVEKNRSYEQYISEIWNILQSQGIDTLDKVHILKNECNAILSKRENTFQKIDGKIVDMLIGVPLGALIASVIYSGSKAVPTAILVTVLIGITILGILKFFSFLNYYSDGYFKDKCLEDTLNELDYSDRIVDKDKHE